MSKLSNSGIALCLHNCHCNKIIDLVGWKTIKPLCFILVPVGFMMVSCDSGSDNVVDEKIEIQLSPEEEVAVERQNRISFDMLDFYGAELENSNFALSPLSSQFALGLCANGASGNSLSEIKKALNMSSVEVMNGLNHKLITELQKLDGGKSLSLANSVWVNQESNIHPSYVRTVSDYYSADVYSADLSANDAVSKINKWCSDKTNDLIDEVLNQPYGKNYFGILMNVLYFNGKWSVPFDRNNTVVKAFTNSDGSVSNVDMMCNKLNAIYAHRDGYSRVKLTYGDGSFGMTIILPDDEADLSDAIEKFSSLSAGERSVADWYECDVELPRFNITTSVRLNEYFENIGIKEIFMDDKADFTKLSDTAFSIGEIKQVTSLRVDEEGTEAASVTITGATTAVGPIPQTEFHVNRPFAFVIDETSTGAILMAGCVRKL